ncbi:MAG: hypothetical protein GF355_01075 [Candidatus Eisenbacteria bacterium]|nr:hypothetical protein [Candidatus Eisenbacteria bacterium]
MHRTRLYLAVILVLLAGFLPACTPKVPLYNERAYHYAIALKVESMALMGRAAEPFERYEERATKLELRLQEAYEYARGRPHNEIAAMQWEILIDPEGHLIGGFLRKWETDTTLSKRFLQEMKLQVAEAFDTISGLENGRIKPDEMD